MSKRATHAVRTAATAASLAATLLLSGCGAEGDGSSGKIEGADSGKKTSSPSVSADKNGGTGENGDKGGPVAPEFDFPQGVKADIADEHTGDKEKDAVLRDHGYALRAVVLSVAKADADLPVDSRFLWGDANDALRYHVSKFKKDGKVGTGVYRYYDRKAEVRDNDSAVVTYCESERDAFAKVVKTGKVLRTEPSPDDFSRYHARMEKKNGEWKTMSLTAKTDPTCER
ncbi:hypothetical protein [Streptomyces axinellae]|uniref:Lipoprotein n=1 Tax=Streptomyces axinellae TaxID=552788 RepID=A0ABP6CWI0_9ACTN